MMSRDDAAVAKGMLARGDKQSDIAAFFGVNGGRIAEINKRKRFADVAPAPASELPVIGKTAGEALRALWRARVACETARDALDEAINALRRAEHGLT